MALTTAVGDDDLNIHKLNALGIVGYAVANFVPILRGNMQRKQQPLFKTSKMDKSDKSSDFIELCDGLWKCLEQNEQLSSLLVCNLLI